MTLQLNQVTLPCTDFNASRDFYLTLGLTCIVSSPPHYARFECTTTSGETPATLSIEAVDAWSGSDWPLVYLETQDLDCMAAQLEAGGIKLLSRPEDKPWLWRECDLRDPSGNRIRLYQAGRNRRFPPWRIDTP